MRYRILSTVLWLYTMMQSEINIQVIIVWIIAFFAMSYKWTYVFPSITLLAVLGTHYTIDTWYYVCLFLAVMSMFISIFTLPYGSVNMSSTESMDCGYSSGDIGSCDTGDGGC